MSRAPRYPVMQGHLHQHGINIHTAGVMSGKLAAIRNSGIKSDLTSDHHGFTKPQASNNNGRVASYVDQLETVLPGVKLIRPIWNLYSFDQDGWFYGNDLALFRELRTRGWKIMLTMFDGPTQRYLQQHLHRGHEHVMTVLRRRQVYAWTRMMESLKREGLLDAIYGYEPFNEPNGYNQIENAGMSTARAVWHYTESCKAVWDIALSYNPNPILLMAGWRWSASMIPMSQVPIPEYGGLSALDHLAQRYPGKKIIASLHHGPGFWGGSDVNPAPKKSWEEYSQSNMGRWSDWRYNPNQVYLTEILGVRNNGANMAPVEEPSQGGSQRNLDAVHYFGLSCWWWPFSNFAKARLIDLNMNGSTVQEFFRHTVSACTALYCYPNRPEWFKGPQQGIKDETSPDSLVLTMIPTKNYDIANVEAGFAAKAPRPANTRRFTRFFGGKGTCVISTTPGQFNSVFGGDGWTVVNSADDAWDITFLGRGGGVVRTGAGFNIVHTRWGKARVYAGPGHNVLFCFTGETPFPKINALDHETTLILDPAGTHYVYDLHRCNHRVSFRGAFRTEAELRAACSYMPSSLPGVWSHDLLIQLPGGGSVRCAYGVQVMEKLVARCRDLKEGWYAPGWSEPADYDPAALTAPLVDPSPAMDALYVWQAGSSPIFDRAGEPFEIFGAAGEPLEIALKEVA